jgi:AraC-like DNA-binding protein
MEHRAAEVAPISVYREFAPRAELREYVRALAWFGPAGVSAGSRAPMREFYVGNYDALTPSFADAHTSLLFALGVSYSNNRWQSCSHAEPTVMGAVTRATQPPGVERSGMIGVYLRPRGSVALLGVRASELTDRIVSLRELWREFEMSPDETSVESVEALLVRRLSILSSSQRATQIAALASHVRATGGCVSVAEMADLAGLSRQHLRRLFLEHIGIGPDLYARLARFRTGLRYVGDLESAGGWSRLSARLGYADQSHLIAEFREFTSFTPEQLTHGNHFHPFIGDNGGVP